MLRGRSPRRLRNGLPSQPNAGRSACPSRTHIKESLEDPEFRAEYERLAPYEGLARIVIMRRAALGLTQARAGRSAWARRPQWSHASRSASTPPARALARRWQGLDGEIKEHDRLLDTLTAQMAPALREAFGIGVDVAAEMLILAGDNPERIRSEAAFAKLCGASPIPASSGTPSGTASTGPVTARPTVPSTDP